MSFVVTDLRHEFTILRNGSMQPIVYFDNAASSLTPDCVLQAMNAYYEQYRSNIHRGLHPWSQRATEEYEHARKIIHHALGATDTHHVIFTRGTTESMNIIAAGLPPKKKERVLITHFEHHANIVPWHLHLMNPQEQLHVVPLVDNSFSLSAFKKALADVKPTLVSLTAVSNALGTTLPIEECVQLAKECGALVAIDAAQLIPHTAIDLKKLDVDFLVFSGHKVFGPTGIGVLAGKNTSLELLKPLLGGGDMIERVDFFDVRYAQLPARLEAGTPPIAEAIGLAQSFSWLNSFDRDAARTHEKQLFHHVYDSLLKIPAVEIHSPRLQSSSILSCTVAQTHPYDLATLLSEQSIAVRSGLLCAEPLLRALQLPGVLRVSLSYYNTAEETERFIQAFKNSLRILGVT
jgi:cysteine desulfurase/selenocysteine lyase